MSDTTKKHIWSAVISGIGAVCGYAVLALAGTKYAWAIPIASAVGAWSTNWIKVNSGY